MRLNLCARRKGCKPMMAFTPAPTLLGRLGASCAEVYVMPSLVTLVMVTARLFCICLAEARAYTLEPSSDTSVISNPSFLSHAIRASRSLSFNSYDFCNSPGETVSPGELQKSYELNDKDRDALIAWLKKEGFEITEVSDDGSSVYARASAKQIQKSLAVTMTSVTKDGITYTSAQDAPSLPSKVGAGVNAIIGLQPFRRAHKFSRMRVPYHANRASMNGTAASTKTSAASKSTTKKAAKKGGTGAAGPTTNIANNQ